MIDYNLLTYTVKNGEPRAGLHMAERVHDLNNLLYITEGSLAEGHHRAMDLFTPVWNLFDLLPSGRGDWFPQHFYTE
jgi:hypothetical protein